MQADGMIMGGHTHEHRPLKALSDADLASDLRTCRDLLNQRLQHQDRWPFCYPYGKRDSFDRRAIRSLQDLGFCCSFSTERGSNEPGVDPFAICRVDCNQVEQATAAI